MYAVRTGIPAGSEGAGKIPGSGSAISASDIGFPDIFAGTDVSGAVCRVLVGAGAVAYGANLCYT